MKLGISLSGGGARGVAHVGFIKAIQEAGIEITMYTGTSAGAIVAAFICYGYTPDEVMDIIRSVKLYKFIRPAISRSGLLKMETTRNIYAKYFLNDDFIHLKKPLVIASTNINKGKNVFFNSGSIINAIMASTAVPVIFYPIKIESEYYIDGGILNNLPVEPLIGHVDKIIGVNCNPIDPEYALGNFKSLMERSLLMAINVNTHSKKHLCDLFLEAPRLKGFGGFEFNRAEELFEIGYEFGREQIDTIKTLISDCQ